MDHEQIFHFARDKDFIRRYLKHSNTDTPQKPEAFYIYRLQQPRLFILPYTAKGLTGHGLKGDLKTRGKDSP